MRKQFEIARDEHNRPITLIEVNDGFWMLRLSNMAIPLSTGQIQEMAEKVSDDWLEKYEAGGERAPGSTPTEE